MVKGLHKLGFLMAFGLGFALTAAGQGRGFSAPVRSFSAPARGFSSPVRSFAAPTRPLAASMRGSMGRSLSGVRRGFTRPRRAGRRFFQPSEFQPCELFIEGLCGGIFAPPIITAAPQEPNFGLINGVPGLGFDFPHLAAINRGFNNQAGFLNAFNNGFFNNGFFGNGFGFIPFSGSFGGYYPPYEEEETPDYYAEGGHQPIFVVPSPQQSAGLPPQTAPAAPAAAPQTPPTPPPELGQLILVRRDGQVTLAVAFTVRNGQLTYITQEGTRHSFPVGELDKEATRQMNDANGTSVSIPN